MTDTHGKILVIRGGAIGDFVLTLPALRALRDMFPHTRIEILGYPHIVQIAEIGGLVDAAHSIDARPLAGFFARNGDLDPAQSAFFEDFNIIVSYLYDPDGFFQANVARCSLAQFHSGPHRPREDDGVHAAETFLKPLERLAIFGADPTPRIEVSPWRDEESEQLISPGSRWLAAHPGSGSEAKNWPEENWVSLLKQIVEETDLNLLVVGGEAEGDRLERLAEELPETRRFVLRNRPLAQTAQWLKLCRGFVGHDSGITHLASAVGLPGVVFWGETNAAVWRPDAELMRLLPGGAGLRGISVEQAFEAISAMFAGQSSADA